VTPGDRERWDAKWAGERGERRDPPDAFVLAALERLGNIAPGRALDLFAGTGRHALELARRGWKTAAWDVSPVGLGILAERASAEGLEVETRAVDLLTDGLEDTEPFDLVVAVNFLDRPFLEELHRLVAIGGHVIFTTVTVDHPGSKPPPDFRLARGELERPLPGLARLLHEENGGRAGLVAARRQGGARAPGAG
jgi:SAM-dependent methyltransferase